MTKPDYDLMRQMIADGMNLHPSVVMLLIEKAEKYDDQNAS